jgi:hypothetical protein
MTEPSIVDWEAFSKVAYGKSNPWTKDKCKLGEFLDTLTPDRRELVMSVIDDKSVSGRTLLQALYQIAYPGGRYTMQEHRRRSCPCYRESD